MLLILLVSPRVHTGAICGRIYPMIIFHDHFFENYLYFSDLLKKGQDFFPQPNKQLHYLKRINYLEL